MIKIKHTSKASSRSHFEKNICVPLKCNRSQQEAMGFIIIVVMVMVIGTIFLGISLRKTGGVETKSAEVANFLSASLSCTSECYRDSEPNYRSLGDLAKDCAGIGGITGVVCPGQKTPCEALNQTYTEMLSKFKPAGLLSYYELSFTYNATGIERRYMSITSGKPINCGAKRAGREYINIEGGNIAVELEVCENA